MLWFIVKGGPVMIPIILGSILGLAIIIEKIIVLFRAKIDIDNFIREVFALIRAGEYDAATNVCAKKIRAPLAVVFKAGIERRTLARPELERSLERIGTSQVVYLEKYLGGLISIIGIEPLLGFLGTITGLIKAFMMWEKAGSNVTVSALASGMYEAMITTAAGLTVAVPFYLICNFIISRIKYLSHEISDYSMQLVDVLDQTRVRA